MKAINLESTSLQHSDFTTKEQAEFVTRGSLETYWRLRDPMCAEFLQFGSKAAHQPAAKAFFPFLRDFSVLELPQTFELFPNWLGLAFHAGYLFGAHLPSEAEAILEHNGVERAEDLWRVKLLKNKMGRYRPTPDNLYRVFQHLCEVEWKSEPDCALSHAIMSTSFGAFTTGLATATLAKADPFLVEFAEQITPPGQCLLHAIKLAVADVESPVGLWAASVGVDGPSVAQVGGGILSEVPS